MDELLEILNDIQPDVDYETCTNLIDGHFLDSLAILSLIAEIEDEFDITVSTVEIIPSNFNSAQSIYSMILRLQEEQ
ncbi:MAG: phosphopantetheine-binding protein [Clostridia bacterium]